MKYITVEIRHWTKRPDYKKKLAWLKKIKKRLNEWK